MIPESKKYFLGKGTVYFGKQIRFPKSKKKRIRRKWAKRAKNWSTGIVPLKCLNFDIELSSIHDECRGHEVDCISYGVNTWMPLKFTNSFIKGEHHE